MGRDPRNHLFYLITMDSRGREVPQGAQLISGQVPMKQDLLLSSDMLLHDRPPIVNSHTTHAMLYFYVCVCVICVMSEGN